ncbi:lipopolysaccharide biosynthesis protein [Marinitoga litoralis]|uniref:lipopolysaccharide biosynthesis protein n=1 Tax=Marinitoga litoralis TaxID=570855 RepID=UPI00195F6E3E|nr:lipopolysaccharide biosynthesis protein [Marinitoga litoralis]MBM7560332.1 O-antigen/teichoic acid export membrane protein [Marinitoga litoralis]
MNESKKFLESLLSFSIGPVFSSFFNFFIVVATTWFVAPQELGKVSMYTLAVQITSLFLLLGMDQAFIREYHEKNNKLLLLWNAFIVPFIFSIFLGIFYIIFYKQISLLLFSEINRIIILSLSLTLPLMVLERFNNLIIRMSENGKLYSLIIILKQIFRLLFLILFLYFFSRNYITIIIAELFALTFEILISFYFVRNFWKGKKQIDKHIIMKLIHYGTPLIPTAILSWGFNSLDKMALRTWTDFNEIGIYSAGFKIIGVLTIVRTAFSTFWTPTAYRWHKEKQKGEKFVLVSKSLMLILLFLTSIVIILKDYIILILSPLYSSASNLIPFLIYIPILYTLSETTMLGINFSRKTYYHIIITAFTTIFNFFGNFYLVPKYGAMGASLSTGASYILFFWLRTLISQKYLEFKLPLGFYFKNILLMILLSITSFKGISYIIVIFILIVLFNLNDIKYTIKTILGGLSNA